MSKRYGRNQKRQHRQRIAELEKLNSVLVVETSRARNTAFRAQCDARDALDRAITKLANSEPLIKDAVQRVLDDLERAYGPHLRDAAELIVAAASRMDRRPLEPVIDARLDALRQDAVVRVVGTIPAVSWAVHVAAPISRAFA